MVSEEEADEEMEMALKTDIGGPYISRAAAGKEPQVIQVQCALLQLEAMGKAFCMPFCMPARGMFTPPGHAERATATERQVQRRSIAIDPPWGPLMRSCLARP